MSEVESVPDPVPSSDTEKTEKDSGSKRKREDAETTKEEEETRI